MKKNFAIIGLSLISAATIVGCGSKTVQTEHVQSNVIEDMESTVQTVEISGAEDEDTQGYITITPNGEISSD